MNAPQLSGAMRPVISVRGLSKVYDLGSTRVHALRHVDLDIFAGELVAVMGPSGSGKSTLMNIIGCLDQSTEGEYWLDGINVSDMSEDELAQVRNRKMGFVFQQFNLLPRTTALRQVQLPMIYSGAEDREERAIKALEAVGLGSRLDHKPTELSGGQQQRVAVARALVNNPTLIMADEPTGALDTRSGQELLAIFQRLNSQGKTIIMVTHEYDVAMHCKRIVRFKDGRMVSDEPVTSPLNASEELAKLPRFADEEMEDREEEAVP